MGEGGAFLRSDHENGPQGDLNYRRLVGDAHWAVDTPFSFVVNYLPEGTNLLALRTLKSCSLCGLWIIDIAENHVGLVYLLLSLGDSLQDGVVGLLMNGTCRGGFGGGPACREGAGTGVEILWRIRCGPVLAKHSGVCIKGSVRSEGFFTSVHHRDDDDHHHVQSSS